MNKILATIKKISSAKLYFFKPKKVDILIWGVPLFIEILKEKKYNLDFRKIGFIHIWGESYNLNILLRCIIKFKFSFLEYTNEYIKHTRPKIILSFLSSQQVNRLLHLKIILSSLLEIIKNYIFLMLTIQI